MPDFTLHWARVPCELADGRVPPDAALIALWPAPVNADACFKAAGFTNFVGADDAWDRHADELLDGLIFELSAHGEPRLISAPLQTAPGVLRRLAGARAETLPLAEQINWPMRDDSLPDAEVAFGPVVRLRAGSGHLLVWIALAESDADTFAADVLPRLAGAAPLHRTQLDFRPLLW